MITKEMILEAAKQSKEIHTKDDIKYTIDLVHITDIMPGDTVVHDDKLMTVNKKDIKSDALMGTSLFGDSYRSGKTLVKRAIILRAQTK